MSVVHKCSVALLVEPLVAVPSPAPVPWSNWAGCAGPTVGLAGVKSFGAMERFDSAPEALQAVLSMLLRPAVV